MKSFYLTDAGKVRDHNEDSVIIVSNKDNDYLMAIADGMGGHSAGEVASSIAINYLGKHFKDTFMNMSKVDAVNWIRDSVNEINSLIFKHEKTHPESKGMGTTLVMALLTKEEASVHPKKNVLMKALGASMEVDVDIFDCDMDISEILLSSDGLTGMLEREQIERVLLGVGGVEDKVIKLIRKANNRGGTDNISVAYLVREEGEDK